jgi:hypothetical protein
VGLTGLKGTPGVAMSIALRSRASFRTVGHAAVLASIIMLSSACAGGTQSEAGATCPATDPQCLEDQTVIIGPADPGNDSDWDEFPSDQAREEAQSLLGMNEADLPDEVRIGRKGDESYMLTQDYVLGRNTVELDDTGDGYKVVSVRVELPDGPEVFTAED